MFAPYSYAQSLKETQQCKMQNIYKMIRNRSIPIKVPKNNYFYCYTILNTFSVFQKQMLAPQFKIREISLLYDMHHAHHRSTRGGLSTRRFIVKIENAWSAGQGVRKKSVIVFLNFSINNFMHTFKTNNN